MSFRMPHFWRVPYYRHALLERSPTIFVFLVYVWTKDSRVVVHAPASL